MVNNDNKSIEDLINELNDTKKSLIKYKQLNTNANKKIQQLKSKLFLIKSILEKNLEFHRKFIELYDCMLKNDKGIERFLSDSYLRDIFKNSV